MADTASERQPKRAQYYPMRMVRSDGQNYDYESNVLRDVPGEKLQDDDDLDRATREKWEIVLGMFLKDQLADKDDKREFKLEAFPEGYELRCVKKTSDETKKDYFLYGHPLGERSKYRSPADFFPHLFWLAGDSKEYTDCSCDFCNRLAEREKLKATRSGDVTTSTPVPVPVPMVATATRAAKPPSATNASASAAGPGTAKPVTQGATLAPSQALLTSINTPVPPGTTRRSNIFRLGEMVWFKTKAWRIGAIIETAVTAPGMPGPGDDNAYAFTIAPLGHNLLVQDATSKTALEMRPFLTFSVPSTTDEELAGKAFWQVNWQENITKLIQEPDERTRSNKLQVAGLEASKMAARAVNDAYSVFNQIKSASKPEGMEYDYAGVFLGAEMIHLGDAVRAGYSPPGSQEPIAVTMLVSRIHVKTNRYNQPPRSLELFGNLYRLVRGAQDQSTPVAHAAHAATLGPYFSEELANYNAISQHHPGMTWRWALVEQNARRAEGEIHGRSYVSNKLMKIVNEQGFEQARQSGQVMDASSCLNKRPHSGSNGTHHLGCVVNRRQAFMESINAPFQLPGNIKESFPAP